MEKEFRRLLSILIEDTPEEIRSAKKEIEKLWHKNTKVFQKSAPLVFKYLPKFDQIKKVENQTALASGLSLFFLALGDEYFDKLVDFTLKVLQHPNGSVREAIRHSADWLFVSLTARAEPFVFPKGKKLTKEQKAIQSEAQLQYINLVREVEILIDKYDEGTGKVRYIDEMKPSVNKSLQLFWSRLTECPVYRRILEHVRPLSYEIARKRKEIENELSDMLKQTQSDYDLEDIKEIIYNENGSDSLTAIIAMFDTGQGISELKNILETVNDAWNYFPHKSLNGLSPAEKIEQYNKTN